MNTPSTVRELPGGSDRALPWEDRIRGILEVAAQVGTGVPLEDLATLLPRDAPAGGEEMADWLSVRPELARLDAGRAFAPRLTGLLEDPSRRERGREYLRAAEGLRDSTFHPVLPLLLTLGVTGSTAYGEPEQGDDLDLLVIARRGALWVFLAYAYLALRMGRGPRLGGQEAVVCINYARDATGAVEDYSHPQDFLFAREALTTRVLHGATFYAGVLGGASWMGKEIPRLYEKRRGPPASHPPAVAPWPLRILNLAIFPLLAMYLQVQGLRRNARFRQRGEGDDTFRTETRLRSVSFISQRFERRREGYGHPGPGSAAVPRSSMDPPPVPGSAAPGS